MFRTISTLLLSSLLAATAGAADIPDVVIQYADAFARTQSGDGLSRPEESLHGHALREAYAASFFQGLTHPHGGVYTNSALRQDAWTRGQAWWREHPLERARIMAEYGYVVVEREGVWSRGFEKSVFMPRDADREGWWMSTLGDRAWSEVGLELGPGHAPATRVRIVGYLSSKGRYGHIGGWEREVLVTSAARVEP